MPHDLSFADGYAAGRRAALFGIAFQAGCDCRGPFMGPYQAGYESGRNDVAEHAERVLACADTRSHDLQRIWLCRVVHMVPPS